MKNMQPRNSIWSKPIHALSPQELALNVSPAVHVSVLVGATDDVAPPSMSRDYAETLKKRVSNVTLTVAPELGHEILLEPVAYETLTSLVESLRRSEQR
jgi:predicted esterase